MTAGELRSLTVNVANNAEVEFLLPDGKSLILLGYSTANPKLIEQGEGMPKLITGESKLTLILGKGE